ncbi:uncharacterized protein LOC131427613 [Malaya genurostris]|uniref:uncharacterized protein LOC131427613 n=1 Tax=Malaya genurostris TaxID=325434 RepID=UPI0026F3D665|nr:uncharacterized protein LOC131427613 [Malaya genurostris]
MEPDFTNPALNHVKFEFDDFYEDDPVQNLSTPVKQEPNDFYYDEEHKFEHCFDENIAQTTNFACDSSSQIEELPRQYTLEELTPTLKDPRCDPDWNLASLWPVFVSNFHCHSRAQLDYAIRSYFASKGLFVRWWFHQTDDYFHEFLAVAGLYDMLVYFVSEKDANLAIKRCHRNVFGGYSLNVFDGRDPARFPISNSIYFQNMKSGRVFSELFFGRHMSRFGDVACAVKYDLKTGAVEYYNSIDKQTAVKKVRLWKPLLLPRDLKKQRYLENDVKSDILLCLQNNPDALTLRMNKITQSFLKGEPIPLPRELFETKRPQPLRRGPTKNQMMKKLHAKTRSDRQRIRKSLASGKTPRCFQKHKEAKKRFHKLVEQVKREMGIPS